MLGGGALLPFRINLGITIGSNAEIFKNTEYRKSFVFLYERECIPKLVLIFGDSKRQYFYKLYSYEKQCGTILRCSYC